ncbi:hypothetical protein VTJ49DRAFT_4553 [Mycothermus thermophilus]|uniref:GAF domain-containing protein n=1 Tax=Humicola insolens TaxID=85995 RepID=A0ABR3VM16_HUMIN
MEMVIPPRDHGSTTYRYTWDENGEVTQVTRVHHVRPFSTSNGGGIQTTQWPLQSTISTATNNTVDDSPTASTSTTPRISYQPSPHHLHRLTTTFTQSVASSTWQLAALQINRGGASSQSRQSSRSSYGGGGSPSGSLHSSSSGSSPGRDLVPDYVRSFLVQQDQQDQQEQGPEQEHQRQDDNDNTTTNNNNSSPVDNSPLDDTNDTIDPIDEAISQWTRAGRIERFRFGSGSSGNGLDRVDSREGMSSGARRGQWEEEQRRFLEGEQEDFSPADEKGAIISGDDDDDGCGRGCISFLLLGGGWRSGMALNVLVMLVVLVAAFACLVAAISGLEEGRMAVFAGGCDKARRVDCGLHVVVSVLGVVLLAGAHYAFQVLTSPTRDDVSFAHNRHAWLDIGVPSFRNLRHIETGRAVLAVVVLASAVCVQVMYNAVIYVSQTAPDWKVAHVSESFTKGATFTVFNSNDTRLLNRAELLSLQKLAVRNELIHLTPSTCVNHFNNGEYQQDYSAVLVVTKDGNDNVQPLSRNMITGLTIDPSNTIVQHCLALPAPAPTCEINLNAPLLGTVALLNSVVVVATAAVLFKRPSFFRPLATLGDAIASFLEDPDPTTRGACLLSKADVRRGCWPPFAAQARYWVPREHFWFRSVSGPRWAVSVPLWAVIVGLAAGGLAFATIRAPAGRFSPLGVAGSVPRAVFRLPTDTPPAAAAVVATLPQLLMALLYLAANALLSAYFVSRESSLFAVGGPRPLRVSSAKPFGLQRTSARLALPWAVSGMVGVLFAGMTFVLSQGVVAVAVRRVEVDITNPSSSSLSAVGSRDEDTTLIALGLNNTALLTLVCALGLLAAVITGLGFLKAPRAGKEPGNPMALAGGSCSAVISARCHPLARERGLLLWGRRIMWGVVREGEGDGLAGVHADASTFAEGITKEAAYQQVLDQAEGLFFEQRNWVCCVPNLSNAAALLWHAYQSLPYPSNQVNWAGFYTLDPLSPPTRPQLILGPFQGKVACQTIAFGRGVCGTAAATQQTQLVPDVDAFPGHIACDGASRSEIVVPIVVPATSSGEGEAKKKVVAIIDIDCAVVNGFDEVDREWLAKFADLIARSCDWP